MSLIVRRATRADAAAMAELDQCDHRDRRRRRPTTNPFDAARWMPAIYSLPQLVSCFVAEVDGRIDGFQGLMRSFDPDDPLPDGWATIGTFARVGLTQRGIGAALFAETLGGARCRH